MIDRDGFCQTTVGGVGGGRFVPRRLRELSESPTVAVMLLKQHKRGADDFVAIDTKCFRHCLDKACFSGAQGAVESNDGSWRQGCGQRVAEFCGIFFARRVIDESLHGLPALRKGENESPAGRGLLYFPGDFQQGVSSWGVIVERVSREMCRFPP